MRQSVLPLLAVTAALLASVRAEPTTAPSRLVEFPSVTVDREARQVRVACEALAVETPLEFFCVASGGPEHESVLRTAAKPSHVHAGLLMLDVEPGSPVRYIASKNSWSPPHGPPVRVSVEWKAADGTLIRRGAEELLKPTSNARQPVSPRRWVFAGSNQREDGTYLADLTGYIVTLVNFEHALIDVPRLVGSANETLEWQVAPDGPRRGEAVSMIIEPLGEPASTTRPSTAATQSAAAPTGRSSDPATSHHTDAGLTPEQARLERQIASLRDEWRTTMKPHEPALHAAARSHYNFVSRLRERQRKLIEEADHLEALIDELESAYTELATPRP